MSFSAPLFNETATGQRTASLLPWSIADHDFDLSESESDSLNPEMLLSDWLDLNNGAQAAVTQWLGNGARHRRFTHVISSDTDTPEPVGGKSEIKVMLEPNKMSVGSFVRVLAAMNGLRLAKKLGLLQLFYSIVTESESYDRSPAPLARRKVVSKD
jgi:hypothetical protein